MKQFKAEWQITHNEDVGYGQTEVKNVEKTIDHILTQHNEMCDYLAERDSGMEAKMNKVMAEFATPLLNPMTARPMSEEREDSRKCGCCGERILMSEGHDCPTFKKSTPIFNAEAVRFHGETLNPHDSRVEEEEYEEYVPDKVFDCFDECCDECTVCKYLNFREWAEGCAPAGSSIERKPLIEDYLKRKQANKTTIHQQGVLSERERNYQAVKAIIEDEEHKGVAPFIKRCLDKILEALTPLT